MIDPLCRIDLKRIEKLIAQKRYFILHAPRQTGKTSCLLALMAYLNQQGHYHALYANIEAAQALRGDVNKAMRPICNRIASCAEIYLNDTRLKPEALALLNQDPSHAVTELLTYWAAQHTKPVVLLLDEVDALVGDTLISLLRQIRAGYAQRPAAFPISIILCGIRDVRDYRIHTAQQEIITGGSAFNIRATALRLGNFDESEVRKLWEQHTHDTGQTFDTAIYPELWADTRGQPWLVNALGYELADNMAHLEDRSVPITLEDYRAARETLIQSRTTHLDQLNHKLAEPRVHQVISAILSGTASAADVPVDDILYVEDLGLIRREPGLTIANRIYQESIPRELTYGTQHMLPYPQAWYLTPERRLDMPKLLRAFQQFFREQSDAWIEKFDYKEAGPQLLLQAFLQRIVNGGGRISREYGLGRKRTDLFIEWPEDTQQGYHGPVQRIVLELKIRYHTLSTTLERGVAQTAAYADQCAANEAHLLIFDRRPDIAWDEKIWQTQQTHAQRILQVWGL